MNARRRKKLHAEGWVETSPGRWRKVYSRAEPEHRGARAPQIRVEPNAPGVSNSLPANYEYHKQEGGRFDGEGRPIFDSWAQHDRVMDRARAAGESIGYLGFGSHERLLD